VLLGTTGENRETLRTIDLYCLMCGMNHEINKYHKPVIHLNKTKALVVLLTGHRFIPENLTRCTDSLERKC